MLFVYTLGCSKRVVMMLRCVLSRLHLSQKPNLAALQRACVVYSEVVVRRVHSPEITKAAHAVFRCLYRRSRRDFGDV